MWQPHPRIDTLIKLGAGLSATPNSPLLESMDKKRSSSGAVAIWFAVRHRRFGVQVSLRLPLKLAVLVVAAMLLTGCGASGDEEGVTESIKTYLSAVVRGDGEQACRQLSGGEARNVLQGARAKLPELHATSCASALSRVSRRLTLAGKVALLDADVTNIHIDGSLATAELVAGRTVIRLVSTGERWLISGGLDLWTVRASPHA